MKRVRSLKQILKKDENEKLARKLYVQDGLTMRDMSKVMDMTFQRVQQILVTLSLTPEEIKKHELKRIERMYLDLKNRS